MCQLILEARHKTMVDNTVCFRKRFPILLEDFTGAEFTPQTNLMSSIKLACHLYEMTTP